MRDDYIKQALGKILDPNILINVVSRRVKQLKRGNRPLVESLEKLSPEDVAHAVEMIVTQGPQSFLSEVHLRPVRKP